MKLAILETKLKVKTGTDVKKVVFDFNEALNQDLEKLYPLVFWDIDNSTFRKNLSNGKESFVANVFILGPWDSETDDKFTRWDELISDLETYLSVISNLADISLGDMNVDKELYPAGLLSVDNEIGVRYRVTWKLWC